MFATFLDNISSIASALPGPVAGFVSVVQARTSLYDNAPARLLEIAERGLATLAAKSPPTTESDPLPYSDYLRASLSSFVAIAQHRLGKEETLWRRAYEAAVAAFSKVIENGNQTVYSFLGDYMLMLAEFGEADEALRVTERVTGSPNIGDQQGKSPVALLSCLAQTPAARAILDIGTKLEPTDCEGAFRTYQHAASLAIATNNSALALESIEKALAIHADDPPARRVRGLLRWKANQFQGAADDFVSAIAGDSDDMESRVALARAELELNRPKEALVQLSVVRSKQPENIDAKWLYGAAQIHLGETEAAAGDHKAAEDHWHDAIANLTAALEQRPQHAACLRSRAMAYFDLGEFEKALNDLDLALASDSADVDGHGWRAVVLSQTGKYDEALAAVNVALALARVKPIPAAKRAWLLSIRGRALMAMNWQEPAIADLKEAQSLDPSNLQLTQDLLKAYVERRDWLELAACVREMQSTPSIVPADALNLRKVEIAALRNGRGYIEAFAALDREPSVSAGDAEIVWLRARLLADIGDFQTAEHVLLPPPGAGHPESVDQLSLAGWIVQNLEPRDGEERTALGNRGRALYETALARSQPAVKNKTEDIWLRKGLANALLRAGDTERAFEAYDEIIAECERALREYKPNPRLISLTGWCYHCRGNYTAALRYYEDALNVPEASLPAMFDAALVQIASSATLASRESAVGAEERAANIPSAEPSSRCLERYRTSIEKLDNENIFRRIGILRVALHDLRELAFRVPSLPMGGRAATLLVDKLRALIGEVVDAKPEYKQHLNDFLAIIEISCAKMDSGSEASVT